MISFKKVIATCNKQYRDDVGIFEVPVDNTEYCSCGGKIKKSLIYADNSDKLVPVKICRKCHTVQKG